MDNDGLIDHPQDGDGAVHNNLPAGDANEENPFGSVNVPHLVYNQDENDETIITNCNYFTEDQLFERFHDTSHSNLTLFNFNIRSMNRNFDKLIVLLEKLNFDLSVIGLTETWFSEKPHSLYSLPGYDLVTNNRLTRQGGGVALYVSLKYEYNVQQELNVMSDLLETLFIEMKVPGKRNIVVGIIYRPPQGNVNLFVNENV